MDGISKTAGFPSSGLRLWGGAPRVHLRRRCRCLFGRQRANWQAKPSRMSACWSGWPLRIGEAGHPGPNHDANGCRERSPLVLAEVRLAAPAWVCLCAAAPAATLPVPVSFSIESQLAGTLAGWMEARQRIRCLVCGLSVSERYVAFTQHVGPRLVLLPSTPMTTWRSMAWTCLHLRPFKKFKRTPTLRHVLAPNFESGFGSGPPQW